MMKAIRSLLALLALTFLVGCGTTAAHRDLAAGPAIDFNVSVTCSEPTMRFTGLIISDGRAETVSGTGSSQFHVRGHQVVCSFKKTSPDGQISVAVSEASKKLGDCSSPAQFGGVRAEFLRTPTERHDIFTTF
jgi:hypothetical protein